MKRRCISIIAILTVAFSALGIRIYFLGDSGYAEAAVRNNTKVVTAISKRGTIYDCNMNPLTDTSNMYAASVVMTKDSLSAMRSLLSQDEFEKLIERLEQGGPAVAEIFNPNVNVQGVCVINGKKRYSTNQLARTL